MNYKQFEMRVSQRQAILVVFGIVSVLCGFLFLVELANPAFAVKNLLSAGAATLVSGALMFAYWRGWEPARYVLLIFMTFLIPVVCDHRVLQKNRRVADPAGAKKCVR